MSPTVFREGEFRFFFFSREELRKHIHVYASKGQAKFWLEPTIALADYYGLTKKELNSLQKIIEERYDEIVLAWQKHFGR